MDGAVDIRLIVTLAGILFSVAGAAAVGKMQIKSIIDSLSDVEKRLREIDKRIDKLESGHEVIHSRVKILAEINSVSSLANHNREIAQMQENLLTLQKEVDRHHKMHNGVHP